MKFLKSVLIVGILCTANLYIQASHIKNTDPKTVLGTKTAAATAIAHAASASSSSANAAIENNNKNKKLKAEDEQDMLCNVAHCPVCKNTTAAERKLLLARLKGCLSTKDNIGATFNLPLLSTNCKIALIQEKLKQIEAEYDRPDRASAAAYSSAAASTAAAGFAALDIDTDRPKRPNMNNETWEETVARRRRWAMEANIARFQESQSDAVAGASVIVCTPKKITCNLATITSTSGNVYKIPYIRKEKNLTDYYFTGPDNSVTQIVIANIKTKKEGTCTVVIMQ